MKYNLTINIEDFESEKKPNIQVTMQPTTDGFIYEDKIIKGSPHTFFTDTMGTIHIPNMYPSEYVMTINDNVKRQTLYFNLTGSNQDVNVSDILIPTPINL